MEASGAGTQDARAVARDFIEALNGRDLDAMARLVADDAAFRTAGAELPRGQEGLRALVAAAEDVNLRLVPFRPPSAEEVDGQVHVRLPVRELIGSDDIERVAEFEVRDGRVAAFAVRPLP
jgi:ketosteroid isomerase-like protein